MAILLLDSKPKLISSLFGDGDPGLSGEGGIHYPLVCLADGTLAASLIKRVLVFRIGRVLLKIRISLFLSRGDRDRCG